VKLTELNQLSSYLKKQQPAIVWLGGGDPYDRSAAIDLLAKAKGVAPERIGQDAVMQEIDSSSLLAPKRLLVVEGKLPAKISQAIDAYCERPMDGVTLVVAGGEAGKAGLVVEFPKLAPWKVEEALISWLVAEAKGEGKQFDPDAAQQLVRQVGSDKQTLRSELEKLICFVGDRPRIDRAAVVGVGSVSSSETVWRLGDAILERRRPEAFGIWRSLAHGEGAHAMLAQLRSLWQQGMRICSIIAHGGHPSDVQSAYPYLRGKRLEQRMRLARSYGEERFRNGLIKMQELDLKLKSSSSDPALLVEMLVMELAR
jgi:DNA polymerase III subunit delta